MSKSIERLSPKIWLPLKSHKSCHSYLPGKRSPFGVPLQTILWSFRSHTFVVMPTAPQYAADWSRSQSESADHRTTLWLMGLTDSCTCRPAWPTSLPSRGPKVSWFEQSEAVEVFPWSLKRTEGRSCTFLCVSETVGSRDEYFSYSTWMNQDGNFNMALLSPQRSQA